MKFRRQCSSDHAGISELEEGSFGARSQTSEVEARAGADVCSRERQCEDGFASFGKKANRIQDSMAAERRNRC